MDQGNVGHAWNVPVERIVDLLLTRGVDQMVVAANDVGDAHVVIVDHDGEHIGRIAVATQQHEVVEVLVLPDYAALDLVLNHGFAGLRRLQPDRGLHADRRFRGIAIAPQAVIEARAALGARFLAHRRKFLRRRIAAIGLAAGQQLLGNLAVACGPVELVDDLAIPIEPEPFQPVQNGVDGFPGRSLPVGVLDAQQHLAAAPARVKPVEQRRAGSSDVEKACRRGSKAGDDGIGHEGSGSGQRGHAGGAVVYSRNGA